MLVKEKKGEKHAHLARHTFPSLPFFLLSFLFAASSAPACAPIIAGGQAYNLSALPNVLTFTDPANSWKYHFSLCTPLNGAALSPFCAGEALAYQVPPDGPCFALSKRRGKALLAGPELRMELIGGDICGNWGPQRYVRMELICAHGGATVVVSVAEDCGLCCYRVRVASSAGCAAASRLTAHDPFATKSTPPDETRLQHFLYAGMTLAAACRACMISRCAFISARSFFPSTFPGKRFRFSLCNPLPPSPPPPVATSG